MLPITGVAVEGFAGATDFTPQNEHDAGEQEGLGYSVGLSVALEIDYIRGSDLGAGFAYVGTQLPENAAGEAPMSRGFAAQYWLASGAAFLGNDDLRPRFHMGLLFGQGNTGMLQPYLGAGASYHPKRGTAVHLFAGPHFFAVIEPASGTTYTGLGAFVRVRYRRAFITGCDVTPSEAALEYDPQRPRMVRCR
jgi:hypothetical protein